MPNGKNGKNRTNAEDSDNIKDAFDSEYRIAKDFIRACVSAGIPDPVILNQINLGVLGIETNPDGTPKMEGAKLVTKKISRTTFYTYKKDALSLESIQRDFSDFVKTDYAIQIAGVKATLRVLINIMFKAVMAETDPVKQAKLAHNLFTDMPSYTQFLDIKRKAIQHGKLSLKDKNESNPLATRN